MVVLYAGGVVVVLTFCVLSRPYINVYVVLSFPGGLTSLYQSPYPFTNPSLSKLCHLPLTKKSQSNIKEIITI